LLGDDFLNHQENIKFDLIIMNPPFDRGVEHVLNAWEILKEGGEIIALLNKHSYFNAYNSHRLKFKALVNNFGKIEDLGTCFDNNSNVERTAKVDVVLVKITRKSDKYYQDLGINLAKYPISAINNAKAEYIIRELDLIEK
jgi:methylase of polypeptide subunit release factors